MNDRKLIIRLDGQALDASASTLLIQWLDGMVEIVVTEERTGDARVVLSREQLGALTETFVKAAHAGAEHDTN